MFKRFLFYKNRAPFFLFFCFLYSSPFGQDINCSDNFSLKKKETNISRQKICPDLLLKDVKELYRKIIKAHPNPFIFCSKEDWNQKYKDVLLECETPKTFFEFS